MWNRVISSGSFHSAIFLASLSKSFLHMPFLNFLHILFLVKFVLFLKPFFCFIKVATGIILFLSLIHNTFLHWWSLVSQPPFISKHNFLIHLKCFHYSVSVISLIFLCLISIRSRLCLISIRRPFCFYHFFFQFPPHLPLFLLLFPLLLISLASLYSSSASGIFLPAWRTDIFSLK